MSPAGARFPKSAKLLKHAEFDQVYRDGKRHFSGHMTIFYLERDAGAARVGFTVGRVLGGAVARNRIKRRLREAVRLHLAELATPLDLVVHPKRSVLTAEFAELEREVARFFAKIGRNQQQSVAELRKEPS